ncbi:hypothetical protein RchiOBHm_Chr4g0439081 [Rosa chinensis]|uniref:Transmembrane protein n=1 Tax=Rosa chinensis TaxID=74649 RepID=A0A2P6R2Q3_ROSCH|nr:uncharacterized protein LOC112199717 [Rosa chinensis]PRQ40715.1 hypothetical protein RchiOBHm_Chr4g0439081 [Rosa chinensis]
MASPPLNLWTMLTESKRILTESKRIINAHSRHFLALSVVFLLPISFSSVVYPTLHNLIAERIPHNTQKFFFSIDQPSSLPTTKTLLLALAFALFVFVFSLFALGSITYSVFHGFYGRPVKFISAVRSVRVSFWPVLGTVVASHIVFLLVVLVAVLFLFLVVGVFEMAGLEMEFSSPYFVGLSAVVAISVLLVLLYLQVNWTLAGVVAVVEPRWGFNALCRSANLIRGMRGVALSLVVFFGALSGILGFCSTVSELGLVGATDGWRNWKSLAFVLQIVVFSTAHMLVLLYHAAANTVLYMYCKAVHGELALEIAEEFASEYVSLPFDDGKVPHLVSVAYVR